MNSSDPDIAGKAGDEAFYQRLFNQALKAHASGRLEEAGELYALVLKANPGHAGCMLYSGVMAAQQGRFEKALHLISSAISIDTNFADAYYNRGVVLQEMQRFDQALEDYEKTIALKPDHAEAWSNRGNVLKEFQRFNDAILSFDRSISVRPSYADAYWSKALCLLLMANFEAGWRFYEARWHTGSPEFPVRQTSKPRWTGSTDLCGKTMLLHAEQGLGDTLQFCRYIPILQQMGVTILFEVQKPLLNLMQRMFSDIPVALRGSFEDESFDLHSPMMSLPLALKTDLSSIPVASSYLWADPAKVEHWEARVSNAGRPRIGLVWSGNSNHKNDRNRSIPLRDLVPHLPVGPDYHCLQKELRPDDQQVLTDLNESTAESGRRILQHGEVEDFEDTAALCAQMDLIVSVDTSVAHLAGAMGRPTLVLLPFTPDFRWMLERDDSPWYPSVTLIRQSADRQWVGVLAQVRQWIESCRK